MDKLPDYLESRIERIPESTCWHWTGYCNALGYGVFTIKGNRKRRAHRLVYESLRGPIPDGLELDHLCRVTGCVNPDHLEPVTHHENLKRTAIHTMAKRPTCKYGHSLTDLANARVMTTGHKVKRICRRCEAAAQARCLAKKAA